MIFCCSFRVLWPSGIPTDDGADFWGQGIVVGFSFSFADFFGFEDVGPEDSISDVGSEEEAEWGSEAEGTFFVVAGGEADDAGLLEFADGAIGRDWGNCEVLDDFGDGGHAGDEEVEDDSSVEFIFLGEDVFEEVLAEEEFEVILGGVSWVSVGFEDFCDVCGAHVVFPFDYEFEGFYACAFSCVTYEGADDSLCFFVEHFPELCDWVFGFAEEEFGLAILGSHFYLLPQFYHNLLIESRRGAKEGPPFLEAPLGEGGKEVGLCVWECNPLGVSVKDFENPGQVLGRGFGGGHAVLARISRDFLKV